MGGFFDSESSCGLLITRGGFFTRLSDWLVDGIHPL